MQNFKDLSRRKIAGRFTDEDGDFIKHYGQKEIPVVSHYEEEASMDILRFGEDISEEEYNSK